MYTVRTLTRNVRTVCVLTFNQNVTYISGPSGLYPFEQHTRQSDIYVQKRRTPQKNAPHNQLQYFYTLPEGKVANYNHYSSS